MAHPTQHRPSVRNGLLAALSPEDWAHLELHLEAVELPLDETIDARAVPSMRRSSSRRAWCRLIVELEDGEQAEAEIAGPEGLIGLPLGSRESHLYRCQGDMGGTALRIGAAALDAELDRSATLRGLLLRYARPSTPR